MEASPGHGPMIAAGQVSADLLAAWWRKIARQPACKENASQLQKRGEAMQGPVMATAPTTGLSSPAAVKASVRPRRHQTVLHKKFNFRQIHPY